MSDVITSGSVAIERSLNDSDHAECSEVWPNLGQIVACFRAENLAEFFGQT